MCFSAEASFLAASLAGAIGGACLLQVRSWREAPIAAMPLLFALQQTMEGVVWLTLDASTASATMAVAAFLAIALVVWPLYAPVAALLIEPQIWRRRLMAACLGLGALVAMRLAATISLDAGQATLGAGRICYAVPLENTSLVLLAYVLATTLPLLASSHRVIGQVGAAISVGLAISLAFYQASLPSVWCFFAAAASLGLVLYFPHWRSALTPAPCPVEI